MSPEEEIYQTQVYNKERLKFYWRFKKYGEINIVKKVKKNNNKVKKYKKSNKKSTF